VKKILLWFLSFVIAAGTMVYQRVTGPTYPSRGKIDIFGETIKFRLPRSAENLGDCEVSIAVPSADFSGYMEYKRHGSTDAWTRVALANKKDDKTKKDVLTGFLPKQAMAGKLDYLVYLVSGGKSLSLSGKEAVVIRFRGVVPLFILYPHILIMLLALMFSTRAGLAALGKKDHPGQYAKWAAALFFITGFILGPLMQYFGFGVLWAGFPLGSDLTDTKSLVAMIGWIIALFMMRKGKPARGWVLAASLLLLAAFLIPHSMMGSELDYSKAKGRAFGSSLARGFYPRASTAEVDPRPKPGAPPAVNPPPKISGP
jgi:hypothetical protein